MMKCEHFFVYASMAEIVEIAASHLSSYSFQLMSIKSGKIPSSRIRFVAKSMTGRTLNMRGNLFKYEFYAILKVKYVFSQFILHL